MAPDLSLLMQLVPITTQVVNPTPVHGKVYLIQQNVIMFVSDLWQVCAFLWVLRLPLPIKLIAKIKLKCC
jgi:hypothetical protein